jgi:hypothetical protein
LTATNPHGAPSRVQLAARILLAVVLVAIPVFAGLLALDFLDVRSALREARSGLQEVGGALGDVDVEAAQAALADAEAELSSARSRTESMRWSIGAAAPIVGHSVDATRDVVEAASAAVDLARTAVTEGEQLLVDGLDVAVDEGRIELEPVLAARDLIEGLPIGRLEAARDRLAEPVRGMVPREIREGRHDTLEMADEVLGTATRARALTSALPGFLGAEGSRRYFVGMQTSAELRGTGGLLGFWGVLTFDEGRVTFGETDTYDPEDDTDETEDDTDETETRTGRITSLGGPVGVGVDADPQFAARYGGLWGTSSFSSVNLDPDLPTSARVAMDLYALRTEQRLDGMILLDPAGLQRLLAATGSALPLDDDLADRLGVTADLPTDEFARLTTIDIYEVLGFGHNTERRQALRELGDAAFLRIVDGGWDGVDMARALADAASHRHLQLFSEDDLEQAAFAEVGVVGELSHQTTADLLAVTANNSVGGKQDVHLGHEFDVDVRLRGLAHTSEGDLVAERDTTVRVTVDHPFSEAGTDRYVIGNCYEPDGRARCLEGPRGFNRTWFTAWLPADTRLVDEQVGDDLHPVVGPSPYRGFAVIDHAHVTPPESRATFGVEVAGQAPVQQGREALVYEWRWWRQSKAVPDLLDVTVHAPEGWEVADVEVEGGGDGVGFGVHGAGVDLEAKIEDGAARLTGTVTADTSLRVHLAEQGRIPTD